jgi:FlaA1/EpsC-like NDP-sugar epimerase
MEPKTNTIDPSLPFRRLFIITGQTLLIPLAYYAAFLLRFDFGHTELWLDVFYKTVPLLIVCRLIFFYYIDLFSGWWRYVDFEDIVKIGNAVVFSSLLFISCIVFIFGFKGFPRAVLVLDPVLMFLFLCGVRMFSRVVRQFVDRKRSRGTAKRVLIMGAGNTGVTVLKEIKRSPILNLIPVGFIDDDLQKRNYKIKNLSVLGTHTDIPELVREHSIDEVLIAVPSAPYHQIRKILDICENAGIAYRTMPGISEIITGRTFISSMRDVHPEELLGRPKVSFDSEKDRLKEEIENKCIFVTGAGGSIGSELCRQIARFKPACLVMYERDESHLFYIDNEIRKQYPELNLVSIIGDILNREKFAHLLTTYQPDSIYHAAAYKHVPLMERQPAEALRNNLVGTKVISELAIQFEVPKFVFISTDKAVNPSSVMGTSKRMTEKLLQTHSATPTQFISVRFGNVIGSSGSVIPLFKKQIAEGGPVTVTHPDVTRFLMTIPEAVHLVMLAGSLGKGGEIFLLDMGKPARIADLAKSLIELSGLKPGKDIAINYIGLREGEKLHEELYWEGEDIFPTAHAKIRRLDKTDFNYLHYTVQVQELEKLLSTGYPADKILFETMCAMIPENILDLKRFEHKSRAKLILAKASQE